MSIHNYNAEVSDMPHDEASSSSKGKRKADAAFEEEHVPRQNKRTRKDAGPAPKAAATAPKKPRKRAREPDESTLRKSKRLRGLPPSPIGPLPGRTRRKANVNKGKGKEIRKTPTAQVVTKTTLSPAAAAPKVQRPRLSINTDVTQPTAAPVVVAPRPQRPVLFIDTNLANEYARPIEIPVAQALDRAKTLLENAEHIGRIRWATSPPGIPPPSLTINPNSRVCHWPAPNTAAGTQPPRPPQSPPPPPPQASPPGLTPPPPPPTSPPPAPSAKRSSLRCFAISPPKAGPHRMIVHAPICTCRDFAASEETYQPEEEEYEEPRWPRSVPQFPNPAAEIQAGQVRPTLKKKLFRVYLPQSPSNPTAPLISGFERLSDRQIAEVLSKRADDAAEEAGPHQDNWVSDTFSEAANLAELDPEEEAREYDLVRRETIFTDHAGYLAPLNATLEEREASLFEYDVNNREAMFAAEKEYDPPPTDLYIGDRRALLLSFEHSLDLEAARQRDLSTIYYGGPGSGFDGVETGDHQMHWSERRRIIADGEINATQRRYIATHPDLFSMTERDIAVESIEAQRERLGEESLTEEERQLRHNSGFGGKVWN